MITSRHQNSTQNQNITIGNLFENVEKFRHLVVMVTNTNDIRKDKHAFPMCIPHLIHWRKFYHPICFPRN